MRFGFDPAKPDVLIAALYEHPEQNPIVETWTDAWGTHFDVVGPLGSPDGRNPTVLTAWFVDEGSPRLVTAYPA